MDSKCSFQVACLTLQWSWLGKHSSCQSQGAFRKSLLSPLTSWMAWTEMGQKQIGELNIASVWFFFSPLSSRWNRAAVLKYLRAAKGSLRRYSPFGGNYISQLRYSDTLFERLHAKSERKVWVTYEGPLSVATGWFIFSLWWIRLFSTELLSAQLFSSLYLHSELFLSQE